MSHNLLKTALSQTSFYVSPFLVLGDPTPELSVELAKTAVREGAGMLEIGFPYSDPVADGPAIQAADLRALRGGTSTSQAIAVLGRIREACPYTPLNLLVYGNLVHARGYDRFCGDVSEAGASSLLVPDIPFEESEALRSASRKAGLGHVELVGPLTDPEKLAELDRATDSFLYLVAHQGITGARNSSFEPVAELVRRTRERVIRPLCLGFGLSHPDHIHGARNGGARIAVVGSHLARAIETAWENEHPEREARTLNGFVEALRPLVAAA
jgi:tryptophan synthase alpha chain